MRIHQIWLNDTSIPDYLRSFTTQWMSKGEYRLWTKYDIPEFGPRCVRLVEKALETDWLQATMKYKAASDVLRYHILLKYGGVYVDADIVPKGTLDPPTGIAILIRKDNVFRNNLIAAVSGHPLMQLAIEESEKNLPAPPKSRPTDITGPVMLRQLISEHGFDVTPIDESKVELHQKWRRITGTPE